MMSREFQGNLLMHKTRLRSDRHFVMLVVNSYWVSCLIAGRLDPGDIDVYSYSELAVLLRLGNVADDGGIELMYLEHQVN